MTSLWQPRDQGKMTPDDTRSDTPSSSLLLYALLPSLIQRRMPKLRSLRRSLSQFERTASSCHSRTYSTDSDITPPPSYPQSDAGDVEHILYDMPSTPRRPPSSSGSASPNVEHADSKSGINWRFADPGFSHLSLAAHEASGGAPSATFVRRQYIDGVACMLRGLPRDLSPEEDLTLREALPPALLLCPHPSRTVEQALLRAGLPSSPSATDPLPSRQRSTLHRLVALLTLYLFLAAAALLPHVQRLLRRAWDYDRAHRLSDRAWARGVRAADVVGRRTLVLAQSFCALQDGKVGDVVRETGIYLVQGVSGGVYDGLGRAIRVREGGAEKEIGER